MPLRISSSPADTALIGSEAIVALETVYGGFFAPSDLVVDVELVDLGIMRGINREHREIDEPTDVLSFPLYETLESIRLLPEEGALLGSIVICPEKAEIYGESLAQLVHHGLLHLACFDHETDLEGWKTQEASLLHQLKEAGLDIPGIPL
jgi:rRNA maturation RNase YbeY